MGHECGSRCSSRIPRNIPEIGPLSQLLVRVSTGLIIYTVQQQLQEGSTKYSTKNVHDERKPPVHGKKGRRRPHICTRVMGSRWNQSGIGQATHEGARRAGTRAEVVTGSHMTTSPRRERDGYIGPERF